MYMSDWSPDIETILEKIRTNSVAMASYHKKRYFAYKDKLKYFKLPLIILSSITSIASMGLTNYMRQEDISLLTCLLSLTSAMVASVEMYLGIQKSMENELLTSKDFYLLSVDIFKNLGLEKDHRSKGGRVFLEEKYSDYVKLIENGIPMEKAMTDSLAPIDELLMRTTTPNSQKAPTFGLELHQLSDMPMV